MIQANEDDIQIIGVKKKDSQTRIWFEKRQPNDRSDELDAKSEDDIHPDLHKAIQNMRAIVIDAQNLGKADEHKPVIRQLKIKRPTTGEDSLRIKYERSLPRGASVRSKVDVPIDVLRQKDEYRELHEDWQAEAKAFLLGKRAQGDLFEDDLTSEQTPEDGQAGEEITEDTQPPAGTQKQPQPAGQPRMSAVK